MDNRIKILHDEIERHVIALFEQIDASALTFHNLSHTQDVVGHTQEIVKHCELTENERFIVFAAAWFHDTGHLFAEPSTHELMSCVTMRKFFSKQANNEDIINDIEDCIMATKAPRNPHSLLQKIICDADTFHFGTSQFFKMNERVRRELELKYGELDIRQFNCDTLVMLEQHYFYTDYCKDYLNERKESNLKELRAQIRLLY